MTPDNDPGAPKTRRTAAMPFIMATTLIDMISIGIIIPVMPALVGEFTGSLAEQAFWFGAITFTFAVANFFASPVLGASPTATAGGRCCCSASAALR